MTTLVTFAPVSNYSISADPATSVVGDFNKDGNLDLVSISASSVYLRLGNSSGGFESSQSFGVGYGGTTYSSYYPYDVAVGDFNADGYLDLVTANGSSRTISVLLNNRSGSFSSAITVSIGHGAKNVKVADFDGDGKDDIATGNNSGSISVLKNTGSGSFSIDNVLNIAQTNTRQVAVGDFNGDGYLDLARPNYNGNNIGVQFGDSVGSFGITTYYSVGSNPTEVAVGDFNGDGILDLVSANAGTNTVSVLLSDSSGSFGTALEFNLGSSAPSRLRVGDFNGDGKDDISTGNYDGTISVLLNNTITQGNLTNPNDDIFQIGGSEFTKIKIKIKIKGHSSALLNELGVFSVDDEEGKIDGIAPGVSGYQEKALARSKTIFSILTNNPTGFNADDLSRILEFDGGTRLRFYLKSQGSIIFSSTTTQQITSLSEGGFSIGWKDGSRAESIFDDLQISVQQTDDDLPIGIGLQGGDQGEAIDLRDFGSDTLISGSFSIYREASFNNYVGFYKVMDANGGIDTDGNGTVDVTPGQAGYLQAAINSRVTEIGLSVGNQGSGSHNGSFTGGGIYVPFLVVNSGIDALLDSNTSNDPTVFFTFLGANSDNARHVRLLGDNTFGFEDLVGGGDNDFNDVVVKVNLSISA